MHRRLGLDLQSRGALSFQLWFSSVLVHSPPAVGEEDVPRAAAVSASCLLWLWRRSEYFPSLWQ
ncbi:hypothetical protein Ancab_034527 [Ancistrocladus abbreviatus]